MKILKLRQVVVSLALILSLTFVMDVISDTLKHSRLNPQSTEHHASGLLARVTFLMERIEPSGYLGSGREGIRQKLCDDASQSR
jgi:hypothetical protein